MPSDRPLTDELVTHAGFLRALARGLLADEHLADDVVQQAFLRALARPPESRGFLRAWLGRVVRHLALNRLREDEHRRARERAAARPELDRSSERAALELALQREVAAAVAELDEPYRTVVHLRYFRALAPAAIAQELCVPLKTVETRLTRAHARLRSRLARAWSEQDERARALWLASVPGAGKLIGGALMAKQIVMVGVGGAVLVGLVLTWRALDEEGARAEEPVAAQAPLEMPRSSATASETQEEVEREPAALASEPPAKAPPPAPLSDAELELRRALERLGPVLDRSLEGRLDPGAILDAALLVAAHDIGTPRAELDPGGQLAIPLVGLPEGVSAELLVPSPREKPSIALAIHLPRDATFQHEGLERAGGTVVTVASLDKAGELEKFTIATDVSPTDEALQRPEQSGTFRYTQFARLVTPLASPQDWKLEMTEIVGEPIPDGLRQQIVNSEPPQVLDGGPWPKPDDMRRLARRLQELHETAKARSPR